MNDFSAQIFSNAFHVLRNLMCGQLPFETDAVQELWIFLLFHLCIPSPWNVPSPVRNRFYFFAFYTLELRIRVFFCIKIRALRMYPSCALFAHDPLLSVISLIKVNLFTINAEWVFEVLLLAAIAECFWGNLLRLFFGRLVVVFTDLVGASRDISWCFGLMPMIIVRKRLKNYWIMDLVVIECLIGSHLLPGYQNTWGVSHYKACALC